MARTCALLAVLLLAAPAGAQKVADGFSASHLEPASAGSDWFSLDSLDLRGPARPAIGLTLDWAHRPLVLYGTDGKKTPIVEDQAFVHVGGALVLGNRLRLGAMFPVAVVGTGKSGTLDGVAYKAPSGGGVGDVRLAGDIRLAGVYGSPFTLAFGTLLYIPTGSRSDYTGDEQARIVPRLSAAGETGSFAYAFRAGVDVRRKATDAAKVGSGLALGIAAGLRTFDGRLLLGPEFLVASSFRDFLGAHATPVELLLGGHLKVTEAWRLGAGFGPGLTQGPGAPAFRVLASVDWFPPLPPPDADKDTVLDSEDACPTVPGPRTGDVATNGCPPPPPPPDTDKDGVLDAQDACPTVAGQPSADSKTNGCPPPPPVDTDQDGVLDRDDACPDKVGIKTDDPKTSGCPPDRDKDGIADPDDACPDVIGVQSPEPVKNGCPADRDNDGIPDLQDSCPDQAGLPSEEATKNGCPIARVESTQIKIREQIQFQTKSAKILPESDVIVAAVSEVMIAHPEIKVLRIEGHTDDVGSAATNKRLSQARAKAVADALMKKGIDKKRLKAVGLGKTKPLVDNKSEAGRAFNRRVEFHIE